MVNIFKSLGAIVNTSKMLMQKVGSRSMFIVDQVRYESVILAILKDTKRCNFLVFESSRALFFYQNFDEMVELRRGFIKNNEVI